MFETFCRIIHLSCINASLKQHHLTERCLRLLNCLSCLDVAVKLKQHHLTERCLRRLVVVCVVGIGFWLKQHHLTERCLRLCSLIVSTRSIMRRLKQHHLTERCLRLERANVIMHVNHIP